MFDLMTRPYVPSTRPEPRVSRLRCSVAKGVGVRVGRRLQTAAALVAAAVVLAGCGAEVAGTPQAGPVPVISDGPTTQPIAPETTAASPTGARTTDTSAPSEQTVTKSADSSSAPPTSIRTSAAPTSATKHLLPDPPKDRKYNQYGDVLAQPGVSYGLTATVDGQEQPAFVFRVNSIRVDKGCGKAGGLENPAKPENKHFVVIDLDVELRALTPEQADADGVNFTGSSWEAFDARETPQTGIHTDAALDCLGDDSIGSVNDFAQGALNSGLAVVDIDAAKGTVLLKTAGLEKGWEFSYG